VIRLYLCHLREWLRSKNMSYWPRVAIHTFALVVIYYVLDKLLPPTDTPIMGWVSVISMLPLVAFVAARGWKQLVAAHWFMTGLTASMLLGGVLLDNAELLTRSILPGASALLIWVTRWLFWWHTPRRAVLHLNGETIPLTARGEYCRDCKKMHWALFSAGDAIVFRTGEERFKVEIGRHPAKARIFLPLGRQADGRSFCPPASLVEGLHSSAWRPSYSYIPLK
jgi:hypothetical protein